MFYYLLIIFIIIIAFFAFFGLSIAPWLPIKRKDLKRIDNLANLDSEGVFYDLGCGDGRVCFYMGEKNPNSKIIGIESVLWIYLWARIRQYFSGCKNVEIKFGNAFNENVSNADVIYTFATPKSINNKLKDKFEKELKKNAKVISYSFRIREWKGKSFIDKSSKEMVPIFVYEM